MDDYVWDIAISTQDAGHCIPNGRAGFSASEKPGNDYSQRYPWKQSAEPSQWIGTPCLSFSFFFFAMWKETPHACRGDRAAPENPPCYPSRRVTTHELVQPGPPSRINREFGECCVPPPGP